MLFTVARDGNSQNGVAHTGAQLAQLPPDEVHPADEAAHSVGAVPEG